jgi:hypothetical protein
MLDRPDFLRTVLFLDATRRVAAGALITLATPQLSSMTLISGGILWRTGLSLLPFAAVIARVALRRPPPLHGVWLVILANAGWTIGSFVLLFDGGIAASALGVALVQAIAVALLAELVLMCLRQMPAQA